MHSIHALLLGLLIPLLCLGTALPPFSDTFDLSSAGHLAGRHHHCLDWALLPAVKPDRLFFLLLDQVAAFVRSVEMWSRSMGFPAFAGALLASVLRAQVLSQLCWASWIIVDLPNWTRPVLLARLRPFGWLQL
ncbi:hypothetical protein M441DRAFT_73664 [Trichoderma asperellum CBS 433.97]|uniref:Uncharacterized protein n=1 Tax=Trichoderma asperellum (strain ATCC 204424 / CBS 433.97 / NBRC 101777) TaxID=1042311 RepID=A0A2T3YTJ0_TRIA4|nr:hypothetical protein M441DRAFT_73664 [Trichoderma asperellum CBS 433.97]PTB35891.1 hypothetical protein M441DRAFT_73664 [Trichoderma asperellum CBS 433.97]